MTTNKLRLAALLRAHKEAKVEPNKNLAQVIAERTPLEVGNHSATGMHGEAIVYNDKQQDFIHTMAAGESAVLLGPAGTGKTTSTQGGITALIATGRVPALQSDGHKHLRSGAPGILMCAYTRRATSNIRRVVPEDLKANCITIHKLLEYAPVYNTVIDPESGESKTTMSFEPQRNENNPLPTSIHTIVLEEGSMLGTDLFKKLQAAVQHKVQWIFIGDIEQLVPVFGPAILGFAMLALPTVLLDKVYRQALESPIIRLAHRVLSGVPIPVEEYAEWSEDKNLTIHPWKKKLLDEDAVRVLANFFKAAIKEGAYDPEEDMILMPFNKSCGTLELNKNIANTLARTRGAVTHEVVAGFTKIYLSEGDRILYDKEDAVIVSIEPNLGYDGVSYQEASEHLDYWGCNQDPSATVSTGMLDDVDFLLQQVAGASDDSRVTKSSHKLVLRLPESDRQVTLDKASDLNGILHGYALTVHKSQGSEWRKVFLCFHHSHATMIARELLYTGITRAREELYIICEPETFTKGIKSQRIKGNTLADKAEFFKGKVNGIDKTHHYTF